MTGTAWKRARCGFFNRVACILAVLAMAQIGSAQDESVRPGVNASFKNADVDNYVQRFETESRVIYKYRDAIVGSLGLERGMAVADVGAGTGFFTFMMREKVGAEGKVYAVDISSNFIDHIGEQAAERGFDNVETILCDDESTKLEPNSVDLVYICDTYHHFEYPARVLASIHSALRDGGTLVIVDFERVKGVSPAFALSHVRCGKGQVTDEVKNAGFVFIKEVPMMKEQYIVKFRKRPASE